MSIGGNMTTFFKHSTKLFIATLLALSIAFLMSACGGNTNFQGDWKIVSTTEGETTKDRDALTSALTDNSKTLDEQFKLTIGDDFKFTLYTPASATAQTGTWRKDETQNEDTYKLTTLDNKVYTITYTNTKTIKMQINDTTYYTFSKNK